MNAVSPVAHYERADASLLARTPAIIPNHSWRLDEGWEDMRSYLEQRLQSLKSWRLPWWQHWAELATNILPRRYHWLVTPNLMSRGLPINQNVVDSTPTQAVLMCAAGMMDGLTSPTKNWFQFRPAIRGLEIDTDGKRWLQDFQQTTYDVMAASNFYDAVHQMYEDEVVFGNGPALIYEHRENVINLQTPCAGEYYLTVGPDNQVNGCWREFTQTITQVVEAFGRDALIGSEIPDAWNTKNNLDNEVVVAHAIEPNFPASSEATKPRLGVVPGGYPFREYYWLRGKTSARPLSVRGFHEVPFMVPRWNTRSNEPYGRSPGMDALPDVRQLHQMVRRHAEAVDKLVRPPMLADVALKNEPSSILPGRVTYVANLGEKGGMRPSYAVDPRGIEFMERTIERVQGKVERWFFNDVFLMISQMEGVQPRNELELSERRGEKLLRLGPVIERNLKEMANGISRITAIMQRRGLVRPKPASLTRVPIEIKFVSKLALIQEALKTASMERTLVMGGRMEGAMPGTLDNVDGDKFIRGYGEALDFPADLWRDQDQIKQIRAGRQRAQQAAVAAEQARELTPAMAGAAKNLSETDTGGGISALQMLLGGAQGGVG